MLESKNVLFYLLVSTRVGRTDCSCISSLALFISHCYSVRHFHHDVTLGNQMPGHVSHSVHREASHWASVYYRLRLFYRKVWEMGGESVTKDIYMLGCS